MINDFADDIIRKWPPSVTGTPPIDSLFVLTSLLRLMSSRRGFHTLKVLLDMSAFVNEPSYDAKSVSAMLSSSQLPQATLTMGVLDESKVALMLRGLIHDLEEDASKCLNEILDIRC